MVNSFGAKSFLISSTTKTLLLTRNTRIQSLRGKGIIWNNSWKNGTPAIEMFKTIEIMNLATRYLFEKNPILKKGIFLRSHV